MKKISFFLIFLSFLIIINNSFRYYKNKTSYEIGDWLINYQGGFVRKGLIGEFFFQIYDFTKLNPSLLVLFLIIFLYFIFYFVVLKLLNKITFDKLFIFTLFSPLSFFFPVFNSKATGRKEILFISILSFLCYFLPKIDKKYYLYIYLLSLSLIGLTHEGFIFYFGYLLIPLILLLRPNNINEIKIIGFCILFLTISLLLLTYNFSGTEQHVISICNSIKQFANERCETFGQIAALKWDLNRYITEKNDIYLPKYIFLYSSYAIISFAPLFLMHKYASLKIFIFNTRFSLILLLIVPFVLTLPIYYIAFDWGRYLHTSYISSLIILLFLIKNKMILFNYKLNIQKYNFINKIILPIFFITYCFGWTVPYCCKPEIKSGLFRSIKLGISYYERNGFTLPKYFYK